MGTSGVDADRRAAVKRELHPCEMRFRDFAERYIKIIPKAGGAPIPFRLNVTQLKLDDAIEDQQRKNLPVRVIVLKARQPGISTYSLGRKYQYATTKIGVTTFLAAHDGDSTTTMFERVRLMYDLAPEKPMTRYSNRTELDFSNPDRKQSQVNPGLQSRLLIGTAGQKSLGRSKTLQYLHLSEVAFWPNAQAVLLSLEQTVPNEPDTFEIIESTANGMGGEFYRRWQDAVAGFAQGNYAWIPVFIAWHEIPEYSLPLVEGRMVPIPKCASDETSWLKEEDEHRARYGCTDEQINWRRWTIANKCGNRLIQFQQEYPANADEAFLTSGRPIFDRERLMFRSRELQAIDLRRIGEGKAPRVVKGRLIRTDGGLRFLPGFDGPLSVYRWPQPGREYVIGADSCKGALASPNDPHSDPDSAEAHVYDRFTWEQVAVFRERIEATEYAKVLAELGYYYHAAKLVPESNDHGNTVCVKLQELNYPNLYLRRDFDQIGTKIVERVGWETNRRTRPLVIDAVDSAINERLAIFNDLPTIQQMLSFIRHPKTTKAQADENCHDDAVFASGLALAVMAHAEPVDFQERNDKVKPPDPTEARVAKEIKRCVIQSYREQRERFGDYSSNDVLGSAEEPEFTRPEVGW